jgi:hypothetical protein
MEKGRSSRCRVYSEVAAFRREFIALMGGTAAKERCGYSIASPARASKLSGILGPRILPVSMLITGSDFVGRSTGMSAGPAARCRPGRTAKRHQHQPILIFDAATSEPVEIDLRDTGAPRLSRHAVAGPSARSASEAPRGPGRPKLGVGSSKDGQHACEGVAGAV